jgi:hypothetical protein
MNVSLAEIILAANNNMDDEGTFWIKLLVLIILGVVVGIGSLIKTRAKRLKTQEQYRPKGAVTASQRSKRVEAFQALKDKYVEKFLKTEQPKTIIKEPMFDFEAAETVGGRKKSRKTEKKDLASGMEILELDFLLSIVEKTKGKSKKDVTMRKLAFNELIRREQVVAVDSKALNFYTINKRNIYEKNIQCAAMKAMAERTKSQAEHSVS